ncbi:MAG: hypothetical protein Q8N63_06450 [Nanoarchaeota archaeon]|nr:hypothetical protein [Nanoarchaeota archaeon]
MRAWLKWWIIGGIIGILFIDLANFLIPCLWVLLRFQIKDQCVYGFIWQWDAILINFLIGSMIGIIIFWFKEKLNIRKTKK